MSEPWISIIAVHKIVVVNVASLRMHMHARTHLLTHSEYIHHMHAHTHTHTKRTKNARRATVYSQGMIELMKCKTPQSMHRDMILFSIRYDATELQALKVVDAAVASADVLNVAINRACDLCQGGRFLGARYRDTLTQTKRKLYKVVVDAFETGSVEGMGFDQGKWDSDGKVVVEKVESDTTTKPRHNHTASLL
jgi:hypothetical protein